MSALLDHSPALLATCRAPGADPSSSKTGDHIEKMAIGFSDGASRNVVQRIREYEDATTTLGIYIDVPRPSVKRVEAAFIVSR